MKTPKPSIPPNPTQKPKKDLKNPKQNHPTPQHPNLPIPSPHLTTAVRQGCEAPIGWVQAQDEATRLRVAATKEPRLRLQTSEGVVAGAWGWNLVEGDLFGGLSNEYF